MAKRLNFRDPGFEAAFEALISAKRAPDASVDADVAAILADVRKNGDEAVIALTRRFDGFEATAETLRVDPLDMENAARECPPRQPGRAAPGGVQDRRLPPPAIAPRHGLHG